MNNKFSDEYEDLIKIYQNLHDYGTDKISSKTIFDGKSLKFFFKLIKQLIDSTKSSSLIDFGCGKAKYYFEEIIIEGEDAYKLGKSFMKTLMPSKSSLVKKGHSAQLAIKLMV